MKKFLVNTKEGRKGGSKELKKKGKKRGKTNRKKQNGRPKTSRTNNYIKCNSAAKIH